jgi:hypothetical protein
MVMSSTFNDNHTAWLNTKMSEYEEKIYDMEDDMSSIEENETEIIKYLNDVHFSMPLGLAIRRYLCTKYAKFDAQNNMYVFNFENKKIIVTDYKRDDYDITTDELSEYSDVFIKIDNMFNPNCDGESLTEFTKAEARRMLKVTTFCQRSKMFLISFALHMNAEEMHKFLTDILAEQTYNFRNPDEIIAFFCQSHNEYNSYSSYLSIKEKYKELSANNSICEDSKVNYTQFANNKLKNETNTLEELLEFLKSNQNDFYKTSQTIYNEFMRMYNKAMKNTKYQKLSNDEYINPSTANTIEQFGDRENRINNAIELQQVENNEQLAREMLSFIPRYTNEYTRERKGKNGEKVVVRGIENDFINIRNGERGQKSDKPQTTTLPKEITMNLMISDRLDDLTKQKKPVTRRDLVYIKFYLLSLDMREKEQFSMNDYWIFIDECNDMLVRCGMSRLYPGNRFENLIMLSLLSSNPPEMFENIIEYSFMNEPTYE